MPAPVPPPPETNSPFDSRLTRWRDRLHAIHFKEYWWQFLNRWEAHRWIRITAGLLCLLALLATGLRLWAYPVWLRHNVIKMSREWIAAGKLREAAGSVQQAMELMPEQPEPWQLAAELCRIGNQKLQAVGYARRAAGLAPGNSDLIIAWAAEALRANMTEETERALAKLPPEVAMNSAYALRLRGELARRNLRLNVAQGCFEAAVRLEGALAINEVPLGLVLIRSTTPALRTRGLGLLTKWAGDPEWGPAALRTLLDDAIAAGDRTAMRRWSEALRTHPRCTVGDMPNCLYALFRADEPRYREVLAGLERDHAVNPQAAVQLLGWLAQIGRQEDAVEWLEKLPGAAQQQPPLAVLAAEAFRATGHWRALADRTAAQNWGREFEFLRWAYALAAAHALGQPERAAELGRTLLQHARLNGVHAVFVASSLYSWGLVDEAETIWWQAAELDGRIAADALGALARHYQLQRDAEGQYRVFRRLHFLQPKDPDIANNFAFFALLTGRDEQLAEPITRANLKASPASETYVATRAFALLQQERPTEALALTEPLARQPGHAAAITFAHGLALAATGRKDEARPLLASLPPESLTTREDALIAKALGSN